MESKTAAWLRLRLFADTSLESCTLADLIEVSEVTLLWGGGMLGREGSVQWNQPQLYSQVVEGGQLILGSFLWLL